MKFTHFMIFYERHVLRVVNYGSCTLRIKFYHNSDFHVKHCFCLVSKPWKLILISVNGPTSMLHRLRLTQQ